MPKKAQVTVDMAIGMVIFISMVALSFYYITYISKPAQPLEATLRAQGFGIAEELYQNISWSVYRLPVWINSTNATIWNYDLYFQPDAAVDSNSVAVLDSSMKEIPSAFSDNRVIWVANASEGKNVFYIIHTKNTSLPAKEYSTDLASAGLSTNNSAIKVLFSENGIAGINFSGTELLGNGIDFGTSSIPQNSALPVRAKISYTEGITVKIYSNISKIVVSSSQPFNPILYLQAGFTNFYNGTSYSFSGAGGQFNSLLNFTDVYSSQNGVAVIGRNLNVSVYNTTYREIRIYNTTGFEIYIHSGTYASALLEKDMYLGIQPALIGMPEKTTGVSTERFLALGSMPYSEARSRFGKSMHFNVSAENMSAGRTLPKNQDVIMISRPAVILDRTGNIREANFDAAVWMGSDYA